MAHRLETPLTVIEDHDSAARSIAHFVERLADRCHEGGWPLAMVSFQIHSHGTPGYTLRPDGTFVIGTARDAASLEKLVAQLLSDDATARRRDALADLIRAAAPDQLARVEAALADPDPEPEPTHTLARTAGEGREGTERGEGRAAATPSPGLRPPSPASGRGSNP